MQMVPMPGLFGPPMGKLWLIKIHIEQDTEDVLVISSVNGSALSYWIYSLIQNIQVLYGLMSSVLFYYDIFSQSLSVHVELGYHLQCADILNCILTCFQFGYNLI